MDERCYDSPTQPKRPRVFFTEDQKDSLRQAYAQDPYPNQSTIETLAKSLNVGVKTVINWFHNHRMRAKQQHHAGSGNEGGIKSEQDENSNQSDMSSMSGDINPNSAPINSNPFFPGGMNPADLNQWMFPQFEPVALLHKQMSSQLPGDDSGEDNKENKSMSDEGMDERDGDDSGDDSHHNNNNDGDKKERRDDDGHSDDDDDDNKDDQPKNYSFYGGKDSESTHMFSSPDGSTQAASTASSSGVNKRKRSNPQRVYEGAQLDRTAPAPRPETVPEGQGSVEGSKPSSDLKDEDIAETRSLSVREGNAEKVQKISQSVTHWENGETQKTSSSSNLIEKLQKHLDSPSEDDDWAD